MRQGLSRRLVRRSAQREGGSGEAAKADMTTVLKLGGELLEDAASIAQAGGAIGRLASRGPLVVVHGGGRAVDAEMRAHGEEPRFVDGLRVTDAPALRAAVTVLAGRTNTALTAAVGATGARAVGLTGADAGIGLSHRAGRFRTVAGDEIDLGLVGEPCATDMALLRDLLAFGYVPVVASIGVSREGELLNVNADTFAAHLAASLQAADLLIAGGTAGVLDADGRTIPQLTPAGMDRLMASGAAHSGMVAKLAACRAALEGGVARIAIVDGRHAPDYTVAEGTRIRSTGVDGGSGDGFHHRATELTEKN
jgi:acetylglutamate kinase